MANTLNLGTDGNWGVKKDSLLGYNSENNNYKPLPFDFTRNTVATRVNKDGLIETVGGGKPRIDFLGNTKGALLLENSATNLVTYSEDFSQSTWQKQSAGTASIPIVTSNYAISPNGTLNADRVVFNLNGGTTSADFSQLNDSITANIGDVTNSFWIKSNTTSNYNMAFVNPTQNPISIVVTSEWKRFDVTSTTVSTSTAFKLRLRGSEATSDYADVSVWGAQLEVGSYPTSYIPTQGSIASRSADVCNNGGNDQVINSTEGVLFAEISALANSEDSVRTISIINSSSTSNLVRLYYTNNKIVANVKVGGVTVFEYVHTLSSETEFIKLGLKYKQNDFAFWVNGIEVGSDLLGNVPIGLNVLSFDYAGGSDFYGNSKQIQYYDSALTDTELETLTSWVSFSDMAEGQLYTIE